MVNTMTSLKVYALLAVFDLLGILVTLWGGILPISVGWVLIVLVAILLAHRMIGELRASREY